MDVKLFTLILCIFFLCGVECRSPPQVKGSYMAWGEIVQPMSHESNVTFQIAFEESYDSKSQNAVFYLWFGGKNLTFVKNQNTKQTLLYVETDDHNLACQETSEQEWMQSDFEVSLLSFEDDKGMVKFSLNQLFDLPEKYLLENYQGIATVYRGVPANSWTYEINHKEKSSENSTTLTITSYWSSGQFDTTGGKKIIPLGFNVSRLTWTKNVTVEDYIISVYGFVPDVYDQQHFKPFEGIVCEGRAKTLSFPSVKDIRAISLHSELALPDYQELRYVDTWFDPAKQLVRIDVERFKDEDPLERKVKHYQSEVTIGKMGVVYRVSFYKGEGSCEIIPFAKYENDLQNFFDVKQSLINWKMGKLFGLNDTSYVYIGKTTKNDIPCHLFQGIRVDWPDTSAGIRSLWEWCFNVNMSKNDVMLFKDKEFGLVNVQITILEAINPNYVNYRMNHHFYDVKAQDPNLLDFTSFDIGRCYSDLEKKGLQFYLDLALNMDNKLLAENATSDINFLQKWKAVIYSFTKLPDYSLRVSDLRATIDKERLHIKFNILDVHKDLPDNIKEGMISSSDAEKNLRESIDAGKVSIQHEWKKKEVFTFTAAKSSLTYQIDPNFNPQTVPPFKPTTTTESTTFQFTLKTEPPLKHIIQYTGNQPGTVAGISIAVLLVGMSIGSAGTYYKFVGLPSFLRR